MTRDGSPKPDPAPARTHALTEVFHDWNELIAQVVGDGAVEIDLGDIDMSWGDAPGVTFRDPVLEARYRSVGERILAMPEGRRLGPDFVWSKLASDIKSDMEAAAGRPRPGTFFRLPWRWPTAPNAEVHRLTTEADVVRLRELLEPGQTWIRVDEIDFTAREWDRVQPIARLARRGSSGPAPTGRPKDPALDALRTWARDAKAKDPSIGAEQIVMEAQRRGIWTDRRWNPQNRKILGDRVRTLLGR